VLNVPQGAVAALAQRVARDVAPDVVRPPRAVRRLERDEGERGRSHDRAHRTARREHATVPRDRCRGRLGPHVLPKGCTRLRSDGGPATKPGAQGKGVMPAALAQGEGVVKGAGQSIARLTDRPRSAPSTGRDPCRGPHGGAEREGWRVWHPIYGGIYDEGEVIKRGTETASTQ
jgi:hypothetical protein